MKLLALAALSVAIGFGQGYGCESLDDCQKFIQATPNSSQAYYRIGEICFRDKRYQAAANAFRRALAGDLDPKWTEVWSHLELGKIFDVNNQRTRAVNEYQMVLRTKDNTRGALDEAAKYIEERYKRN